MPGWSGGLGSRRRGHDEHSLDRVDHECTRNSRGQGIIPPAHGDTAQGFPEKVVGSNQRMERSDFSLSLSFGTSAVAARVDLETQLELRLF